MVKICSWRTSQDILSDQLSAEYRAYAQPIFSSLIMPTNKDKEWQFTPCNRIKFAVIPSTVYHHTKYMDLGGGAFLADVSYVATERPDLAQQYLFVRDDEKKKRFFTSLVEGSWNVGYVLVIPTNTHCKLPINFFRGVNCIASFEKLAVIIEKNASLVIQDLPIIYDKAGVMCRSTDYWVGENASLIMSIDEEIGSNNQVFIHDRYHIDESAQLDLVLCSIVSGISKRWLDLLLTGKQASVSVKGLQIVINSGYGEFITQQHHQVGDTRSDLAVRSIVADQSHASYQGMIRIERNAVNADACQQNKNLLLSSNARAWSVPGIEVLNNEVKCFHGSAIGQLDEEQIWYLLSRGLDEKMARTILLEAFITSLLCRVDSADHVNCMIKRYCAILKEK